MRNLNDTIARLAAFKKLQSVPGFAGDDRLQDLTGFGTNPGQLKARIYLPKSLQPGAALVVVLHGCTQNAAGYDHGSGWSKLADAHGFALLFPEQQRSNNANLCFNWFEPFDQRRGHGEPLSIKQMIDTMVRTHAIDPQRIFVNGLSAGGAMTAVMLAAYPELFAGGAIVAGLPYGVATTVPQAFEVMRGEGLPSANELTALVRNASHHQGPWPKLMVFQGTADHTVDAVNADAIVAQWRGLCGLEERPSRTDVIDGFPRRTWDDAEGHHVVEQISITGMGHGTPLDTNGHGALGASGPYMLDVGINSTRQIASFWGLIGRQTEQDAPAEPKHLDHAPTIATGGEPPHPGAEPLRDPRGAASAMPGYEFPRGPQTMLGGASAAGVRKVIEDALRKAGLMS